MAITPRRQTTQVITRRIGVVNVDTGASDVSRTVSQVADRIQSGLEPFLRDNAIREGTDIAEAVRRQNLVTFDENGQPKALTVPSGFGLVGSQAYRAVIDRRFEESMLEELQNKSNEIATKYPFDVGSYTTLMGKYLDDMDSASKGRYNEFIKNNGSKIFAKQKTAIAVAAEKQRLANAKKAADFNLYNALKKLERSRAFTTDVESVKELNYLVGEAEIAARQKYALYKDPVQYAKDLDEINAVKAGSRVNILISASEFLPDSQREAIALAISNRAFINQVEDPSLRALVRSVHTTSGGIGLDKLSSSYSSGADAVKALETARGDEWLDLQVPAMEKFQSDTYKEVGTVFLKTAEWANSAPEQAQQAARDFVLKLAATTFNNKVKKLVSPTGAGAKMSSEEFEDIKRRIFASLATGNTDLISTLPKSLRQDIISLKSSLEPEELEKVKQHLGNYLNPVIEITKATEAANQSAANKKKEEDQIAATNTFVANQALLEQYIEDENFDEAQNLFQVILETGPENLSGAELKDYNRLKAAFSEKFASAKNTAAARDARNSEANRINNKLRDMQEQVSKGEASISNLTLLQNEIDNIIGDNEFGHTETQIASWKDEASKLVIEATKDNETLQDIVLKNKAFASVETLQDIAESGKPISEELLNAYKDSIVDYYEDLKQEPYDPRAVADLHSQLENIYAASVMQPLFTTLNFDTKGSDGLPTGISPQLFALAESIAASKDQKNLNGFLNEVGVDTPAGKLAQGLFDAYNVTEAKSEVRTQINNLSDKNATLWQNFTKRLDRAESIQNVQVYGASASVEDLAAYEESVYKPMLQLAPNQPIDWSNPELIFRDGEMTEFALRLQADFANSIITPSVKKYLESGALTGAFPNASGFQIFVMGSNAAFEGVRLNIWNNRGTNALDPAALARLGAASLLYDLGQASTREEGLALINSQIRDLNQTPRQFVEARLLDGKSLTGWVNKNYPEADAETSSRLYEAAAILGLQAQTEEQLKKNIELWAETSFGNDDKIIGGRLSSDRVSGARNKYLNAKGIQNMNEDVLQKIFAELSGSRAQDRERLFRKYSKTEQAFDVAKFAMRLTISSGLGANEKEAFLRQGILGTGEVEPDQVTRIDGQTLRALFDFGLREAPDAPGLYYVYTKDRNGFFDQFRKADGTPLIVDAFDYKEKTSEAHPSLSKYMTRYRSALQNDPNGAKFERFSYTRAFGQVLGLIDDERPASTLAGVPTRDAERALIFARDPSRIADGNNYAIFKELVQNGTIDADDAMEFAILAGVEPVE